MDETRLAAEEGRKGPWAEAEMKVVRYRVGEAKNTSTLLASVLHDHRVRTWAHQRVRIGHTSDRDGNSAVAGGLEQLLGSEGVATLETASVVLK